MDSPQHQAARNIPCGAMLLRLRSAEVVGLNVVQQSVGRNNRRALRRMESRTTQQYGVFNAAQCYCGQRFANGNK
jgi:hypothetical protein